MSRLGRRTLYNGALVVLILILLRTGDAGFASLDAFIIQSRQVGGTKVVVNTSAN